MIHDQIGTVRKIFGQAIRVVPNGSAIRTTASRTEATANITPSSKTGYRPNYQQFFWSHEIKLLTGLSNQEGPSIYFGGLHISITGAVGYLQRGRSRAWPHLEPACRGASARTDGFSE